MTLLYMIIDVLEKRDFLPLALHIQTDNTMQENKNIYMFSSCTMLVGLGLFKQAKPSFLTIGHLHEDIDQCFNIISNTLKRQNINERVVYPNKTWFIVYRAVH